MSPTEPALSPVPSPVDTSLPATPPAATSEPSPVAPEWRERGDIAAGPSARSDHTWTLADDGIAYVFGGQTADGSSAELWAFDLAANSWSLVQASDSAPDARWGHTGTWVPGAGLVVWSGQNENGFFGDVWSFDPASAAWTELPSAGEVPAARYGSCASLGPDGRLWISHGFTQDDGRFSDTRAYDFGTGEWTDETPTGRVPTERCLHDCFWSADGSQLVLYGGQTTGVPALGDAWAFDAETRDWTASADGAAPARQLFAMAPVEGGALVFGGGSLESNYLADAWLLDAASLAMTQLSAAAGPAARDGATLVHDTAGGRLMLFGGRGENGPLGDVWEIGSP